MKSNQTEAPKYFFNVLHRNIDVRTKEDGTSEQEKSYTGHLYLTLQGNGKIEWFGKYPPKDNLVYGEGRIESGTEESKDNAIIDLPNKTSNPYVRIQQIIITEEQYEKALKYAIETSKGKTKDNTYIIGFADCVDFVQSVYNAAGLPLYFTSAYSKQELANLDTWASTKMSIKYGSRDTIKQHLSITEGGSREQLAKSLNISIDKITPSSPVIDISLHSHDSLLPRYKVALDDSDLLPLSSVRSGIVREDEIGLSTAELLEREMSRLQLNEEDKAEKIKLLEDKVQEFRDTYIQKVRATYNHFIQGKTKEKENNTKELDTQFNVERKARINQYDAEYEELSARISSESVSEKLEIWIIC